ACLLGHTKMAEKLLTHGAKANGKNSSGEPMKNAMWHLEWEMDGHYGIRSEFRAKNALEAVIRLAEVGARWEPERSDLRRFRRNLYFYNPNFSENLIKTLFEFKVCVREVLLILFTAPKMKTYFGFRRSALVKLLQSSRATARAAHSLQTQSPAA